MKKKVFFLTLLFTILMSCTAFCAGNDGSWINWRSDYNYWDADNFLAKQTGKVYLYRNTNPSVTICVNNTSNNSKTLVILSYYNTGQYGQEYLNEGYVSGIENVNRTDYQNLRVDGQLFTDYFTWPSNQTLYYFTTWLGTSITDINVDLECTSFSNLYAKLGEMNFQPPKDSVKFYLKTYCPNGMVNKTEYTLTWDLTNTVIEDPSNYGIEVYCAKTNDNSGGILTGGFTGKKAIKGTDKYPCLLSTQYFTFTIQELRDLFNFGGGFLDQSFWIYVRIVDLSGNPIDNKWVNFHLAKIVEIVGSQEQTWNGNINEDTTNLGNYENGQFEYTDGRSIGGSENGNDLPGGGYNSNGSSVSPSSYQGGITNNTATTSQESGIDYGASLTDLSGNLLGLIQVLGNVPYVLTQICSFLPAWLITLISVSIGMIVVIGTAKLILR